ncbi:MAG TPA: lipopolysaccharide heptosyltransferase II [Gemmataceae bacterium]
MQSPSRIALFLPNWVGDVVMATPAVRAVRRHFPAAKITAVCRPYVAEVLAGAPWLDEVILSDKRGPRSRRAIATALALRRRSIDAAVLFPNSFRAALVARLGGCRRRIGFARYGRSPLLTDRLRPARGRRGRLVPSPVIDDYNRLVERLGVAPPGHRMELFTTPEDERLADRVWAETEIYKADEVIGLNPGAAFGSAKCWPVDSFARLARRFADRRGSAVLVLCGPNERAAARDIVTRAMRPGVRSLAEFPVSIGLTKACVRRLDLLVTTDSGPRHFAAAFDRPVVTLFGPTHVAWTETYFPRAVHLQKKVPCGPCQLRVCPLDHRCMRELGEAEVFAACEDLLLRCSNPLPPGARDAG